jgi:DNA-binding IclR family transcriptional regulator
MATDAQRKGASNRPKHRISRPRVPTLLKAAELLALFTSERPTWRLAEATSALDWDKATTFRMLEGLVAINLLERTDDGEYELGRVAAELGAVYLGTNPRRGQLVAEVKRIAEGTTLTTQIGILDGSEVAIVVSEEGRSYVNATAMLGQRLPIHATATGKALLARMDDAEIAKLLPAEFQAFTPRTITTRDKLMAEIKKIRRGELAQADGELAEGLSSIAIALDEAYFGRNLGALACAGPSFDAVPSAWDVARETLTRRLGEAPHQGGTASASQRLSDSAEADTTVTV